MNNKWTSSTLAILLALNPLYVLGQSINEAHIARKAAQASIKAAKNIQNPLAKAAQATAKTKQVIPQAAKATVRTKQVPAQATPQTAKPEPPVLMGDPTPEVCPLYPTVEEQWEMKLKMAEHFLSQEGIDAKPIETKLLFRLIELQAELNLQMLEEQCALGQDVDAINQVPAKYVDQLNEIENILSWIREPSFNDFMLELQVILNNKNISLEEQMYTIKAQCSSYLQTQILYHGEKEFYTLWEKYADIQLAFINRLIESDNLHEMNEVIAKQYGPKLDALKKILGNYQRELEENQRA